MLVTNVSDKFLAELEKKTGFGSDRRINFVGTVYDQELLKKIRENAYGYFHGPRGGRHQPKPSGSAQPDQTESSAGRGIQPRGSRQSGTLLVQKTRKPCRVDRKADAMTQEEIEAYGEKAKARIQSAYTWDSIVEKYEKLFLEDK